MNTIESAVSTDAKASGPLTDQSVAKQLLFGNVLEENLFPYPAINDRQQQGEPDNGWTHADCSPETRTRTE